MRPVIRKEAQRNEKVPRECGPGLREETSGVITKNQNDRHRGHLKRGTPPLISLLGRDVGTRQPERPEFRSMRHIRTSFDRPTLFEECVSEVPDRYGHQFRLLFLGSKENKIDEAFGYVRG